MALLTEHDVVNMRFKAPNSVKEGYDQDEVDFFLDEVAETIAQLTKDKAELENQLKVAEARVTELPPVSNALAQLVEISLERGHRRAPPYLVVSS